MKGFAITMFQRKYNPLRARGIPAVLLCTMLFFCGCGIGENTVPEDAVSSRSGVDAVYMPVSLDGSSGGQVITKFTNENAYDVDLCVNFAFFGVDGSAKTVSSEENLCLPAGESWYTVFGSDSEYDSYGCDFSVEKAAGFNSEEMDKLYLETYTGEEGEIEYSLTNDWDRQASVEITVFFFSAADASVLGYEKTSIKADGKGKITTGTLPAPEDLTYDINAVYWKIE